MYFPQLQELNDTSSIYSYVMQNGLAEQVGRLGSPSFEGDMVKGQVSFVSPTGRLDLGCQMIASLAPGPRSLMWAWANPGSGRWQTDVSESLRAYGEANGIRMLTQGEVPFEGTDHLDDDGMDEWCKQAVHEIGRAFTTITGRAPYLALDPSGNGQQALFAITGITVPEPRIHVTTPRMITDGMQTAQVQDHRRAIHCFATKSGWRLQWSPDLTSLIIEDPVNGNSAVLGFDELGRNDNIKMTLRPGSQE